MAAHRAPSVLLSIREDQTQCPCGCDLQRAHPQLDMHLIICLKPPFSPFNNHGMAWWMVDDLTGNSTEMSIPCIALFHLTMLHCILPQRGPYLLSKPTQPLDRIYVLIGCPKQVFEGFVCSDDGSIKADSIPCDGQKAVTAPRCRFCRLHNRAQDGLFAL